MASSHPEDTVEIAVRAFIPSDAEGISQLIRRNYGDTYHKRFAYDPDAIRQMNESGRIASVVAHYYETVIGHFALIPSASSSIAEIGIAAVDPAFKHLGVMNRMFDLLCSLAGSMRLNALYGEAIMLHPFSQRANLHHGMTETAVLLGEVPSTIEIEHRYKDAQRSGAMVSYLFFDRDERSLVLPERYRAIIAATYERAKLPFNETPILPAGGSAAAYRYNGALEIGSLLIDTPICAEDLESALDALLSEGCAMIYADINLQRFGNIDETVELLNRSGFFYAGVMYSLHRGQDYLRLQRKNTRNVDEERLHCYSAFGKYLLEFILEDERRISMSG